MIHGGVLPFDASAPIHYENVFNWTDAGSYLWIFAIVFLLGVWAVMLGIEIAPEWKFAPHALAAGVLLLAAGAVGACVIWFVPASVNAGNAEYNIKQKYGATVISNDRPAAEETLVAPYKYTLSFPNGTKGDYMIRFDRATSEPFMAGPDTPPTPAQLEQNAKK